MMEVHTFRLVESRNGQFWEAGLRFDGRLL